MVGVQRMIPMELGRPEVQLIFQRTLGQVLFAPPNVAGWPGGKSWIDSSSLVLRLRLPQVMTYNEQIMLNPKTDDDVMMGREGVDTFAKGYKVNSQVNWDSIISAFSEVKRDNLATAIGDCLLQTGSRIPANVLDRFIDDSSRESYIRTAMVRLMGTPEYQLC